MRLQQPSDLTPDEARLTGVIYLLHFSPAYRHAGHYLGFTHDIAQRLTDHRAGRGARLVAVAHRAGCGIEAVRAWHGTRHDERRLKCRGKGDLCPICAAASGVDPRTPRWIGAELSPDELRLALIHAAEHAA